MPKKAVLITGATDGIGRETAVQLARRGHPVILHGRNSARLADALDAVRAAGNRDDHAATKADFSSLAEVISMAGEIKERAYPIGALVNNAGVYMNDYIPTSDGYEMTFAVNHLAHFLLTVELLDVLEDNRPSRIVNVSSVAHRSGRINFDDVHGSESYGGYAAYAQSKLANVLFTRSLARRVESSAVTANALHPGVISTKLLHAGFDMAGAGVDEGAETSVFLVDSPTVEGVTGRYFARSAEQDAAPQGTNDEDAERLWALSVRMVQSAIPGWEAPL